MSQPDREEIVVRIAIVAPPWVPVPPPAYGGTEVVLDGLARGLAAAGHEVLLYATGDSACTVPTAWTLARAVGIEDTIGPAAVAVELRHVTGAYEAAADFGADVVHDHTLAGPVHGSARGGSPIVTTNHGRFEGVLGDYYRSLGERVAIVAISHHQASTARDTPIAAVIHHGIDLDRFDAGRGAGGYALFLGRMSPDKGVHLAVAAARAAGVPLRIAAKMREPGEREYFESRIAPLLGRDVEYIGEVGGAEKIALVAGARCLLNPIQWDEPFGMVMIEALACGTPVVATRRGAAPEIVDHGRTGFLCSTAAELAEAVAATASLSRAVCRASAVERFSVERMVRDHVALYESIAEAHRGSVRGATG